MTERPSFCLVLHSHIPYCRQAGRWPHGEEWLHEALAETYVPLLSVLHDLHEDGVPFKLVVGLTPVLMEQLADPDIVDRFEAYVRARLAAARADVTRFGVDGPAADPALAELAAWHADWYERVGGAFRNRFARNVVGAFRALQDAGHVDVMTSAATHAYLPLLDTDESIAAQVATGVRSYRRHMGRAPSTFWLPECAYRPSYRLEDGTVRPGLERYLEDAGLAVFFVETHAIAGGHPVGKAAGEALGLYRSVPNRELVELSGAADPGVMTTYRPYRVGTSRVVAVGRDNATSMQVWSAHGGYPGDSVYREFHRKDQESGLHYWAVSGPGVDLGAKVLWHPSAARARAREHARHFAGVVRDTTAALEAAEGPGMAVAMYDTELFGHWWFEGPTWLSETLRLLAEDPLVELTTPVAWLDSHPAPEPAAIPESSWGSGGTHHTWDNADNHWVWPLVHAAELAMRDLAARHRDAVGVRAEILAQAARELLLLQSSDWPFLISTGQAREYAAMRFTEHAAKFNRLAFLADKAVIGPDDEDVLRGYESADNPFGDVRLADWLPEALPPAGW